jgi:hypothetical protein
VTDFITVSAGGPSPENDIPDGVYPVILSALSDPKTVTARRGPKAGQDIDLIDWTFAIDAPGHPMDGRELPESTSTASGPRSKMYSFLTALFGGTPPPAGTKLTKEHLLGRRALATVTHDEGGWLRIGNLGALPPSMVAVAPVAAPAPVVAVPTPAVAAAAPVAAQPDDLPF